MRRHFRLKAWMLFALALLFVLACVFFPVLSCHHECTGDCCCPVCMQIRTWTSTLRLFGALIVCTLLLLIRLFSMHHPAPTLAALHTVRSPVALKTKLLN